MEVRMPTGIGAILAVIVLLVAVVLMVVGGIDFKVGLMLAALAVARLT